MSKDIISYTLTHDELETMLSSEYGTKVEPVDLKQLTKQKMNQQRARMMEKMGIRGNNKKPLFTEWFFYFIILL